MSTTYDFGFKRCPLEVSVDMIGRKWALQILRDLFMGRNRFSDFLEFNPGLSGKVLSTRLRELQENGLVEKRVISVTPLRVEYGLSEKGVALGDVLYQVALFSMRFNTEQVYSRDYEEIERDMSGLRDVFKATT